MCYQNKLPHSWWLIFYKLLAILEFQKIKGGVYMFSKFGEIRLEVWIVLAVVVLLSAGGIFFLSRKRETIPTSSASKTRKVVYGGMCIALAFVLSYIRLYRMPQGGSITPASMLPIIIYSIIFGPVAGITTGIAYGFLQFFQDGSAVHWTQLFLDYPLAFGFLGIAGMTPRKINLPSRIIIGTFIAVLGRGLMHVLSGVIFFAEYAGEQNPWIYSIIYNGTFLSIETIITIVIAVMFSYTQVYKSIQQP